MKVVQSGAVGQKSGDPRGVGGISCLYRVGVIDDVGPPIRCHEGHGGIGQ